VLDFRKTDGKPKGSPSAGFWFVCISSVGSGRIKENFVQVKSSLVKNACSMGQAFLFQN
jgi:hypothetical protein